MNEFLEQFLIESRELLDQANKDLLTMENHPDDKEVVDRAFRAFHTLKGGAGIVDFMAMGRALHGAEDVLAKVRAGERGVTPQLVSACLACLDQVQKWLEGIESAGELPSAAQTDAEADRLVGQFADVLEAKSQPLKRAESSPVAASTMAASILEEQLGLLSEATPEDRAGRWSSAVLVAANVLRATGRSEPAAHVEQALPAALASGNPAAIISSLTAGETSSPDKTPSVSAQELSPRTFRVDGARVDALVDLTGELTVAKNAVGHLAKVAQEAGNVLSDRLHDQHVVLERLIGGLQHAVLGMRVLPLRHVFQRFQRLVREMAVALGKPTRLITEGDDTEADKAVVEALYEPLLHIIRNAMDHGIEPPAQRAASKKDAIATIRLRAFRQGEHVVVEVADDGGGINVARVRAVALERAVASAETLSALNDAEVIDLIFEPGFSTAAQVTAHSGRGVGMDAVRTGLERLGGRVAVESTANEGAVVRMMLPFSVMMTQLMTVEAGGQTFGIPLDAVVETLKIPRSQIQKVGAGFAVVHRERTIPVLDLAETLGKEKHDLDAGKEADATLVLVLAAGQVGAIEVDCLGVKAEAMMKPMPGLLTGLPGVIGTTLLGDGSVLIVLNIPALFS